MSKDTSGTYVSTKVAMEKFGVSDQTLRKWHKEGLINCIRSNGRDTGHRRYDLDSFKGLPKTQEVEKKSKRTKKDIVIVESPQESNKKILDDKLSLCKKSIQSTKLSLILDPGLTLDVKSFSNLSKESLKDVSEKLWLPSGIECADLDLISSNTCAKDLNANFWYSMKKIKQSQKSSPKISFPSLMSSLPKLMEEENTKQEMPKVEVATCPKILSNGERRGDVCGMKVKEGNTMCIRHLRQDVKEGTIIRTFKTRFYPNKQVKKTLKTWFDGARATYNFCITKFNENRNIMPKFTTWKKEYVAKERIINYEPLKYLADVPSDIREFALKEFVTATKNEKEKISKCEKLISFLRSKGITDLGRLEEKLSKLKSFNIKFRKKKDAQSINVVKTCFRCKDGKLFIQSKKNAEPIKFRGRSLKKDELLRNFLTKEYHTHDIKIIKTITNKYYLCVPYDKEVSTNTRENVISIDPGVRTFLTCYDPEGKVVEFSDNDVIDALRGHIRYDKRLGHEKLKNKITDMHRKISSYLTKKYKNIILPEFRSHKILSEGHLSHNTNFRLQALSHYKFRTCLIAKAESSGCNVHICNESYTTKTCGRCFEINEIGASKTYKCNSCGLVADRDIHAARNILIKQII